MTPEVKEILEKLEEWMHPQELMGECYRPSHETYHLMRKFKMWMEDRFKDYSGEIAIIDPMLKLNEIDINKPTSGIEKLSIEEFEKKYPRFKEPESTLDMRVGYLPLDLKSTSEPVFEVVRVKDILEFCITTRDFFEKESKYRDPAEADDTEMHVCRGRALGYQHVINYLQGMKNTSEPES